MRIALGVLGLLICVAVAAPSRADDSNSLSPRAPEGPRKAPKFEKFKLAGKMHTTLVPEGWYFQTYTVPGTITTDVAMLTTDRRGLRVSISASKAPEFPMKPADWVQRSHKNASRQKGNVIQSAPVEMKFLGSTGWAGAVSYTESGKRTQRFTIAALIGGIEYQYDVTSEPGAMTDEEFDTWLGGNDFTLVLKTFTLVK